jgi:PAS domain S-box-containing protein
MDTKDYRILVIEDNMGDFYLIQDYLQERIRDPHITHMKTFNDTSNLLCGEANYDVIFLDLSLPDKSGESLISEVMILCAEIPVIVLTGYADVEFGIRSLSLGIADYLLKDDINGTSLYKSIIYNIERKKSNLKLVESEKRYSELFHIGPQPMWVYALGTLEFLDVNEVAIKHYGYSEKEFLKMTVRDLLVSDGQHHEDVSVKGSCRHHKKNGEIIEVELSGHAVAFKGTKAEIVVINDVTKTMHNIRTIKSQNERLRDIAWIQSHLVRAPLARMMSLIELIKSNMIDESEQDEVLGHVIDASYELDVLIKDISNKTYVAKIEMVESDSIADSSS